MKTKFSFLIVVILLSGCSSTYQKSGQKLLEPSSKYCFSVEIYNGRETEEDGYDVMQRCINDLIETKEKPKNIKIGQKEIYQCLEKNGFSLLETCH